MGGHGIGPAMHALWGPGNQAMPRGGAGRAGLPAPRAGAHPDSRRDRRAAKNLLRGGNSYAAACAFRRLPPFSPPLRAAPHALMYAAARARALGSAMRLRSLSRLLRLLLAAPHSLEQYLTRRLGVENSLPHSLQSTLSILAISLSALAAHRLQWTGREPRPYGSKWRPHSPQAYCSAASALRLGITAALPARGGDGGRFPRSPPLRAARDALARASFRARFSGSAVYLR